MHHRYGNNSSNSTISTSSSTGIFLGTAREKREKLLRKACLSQQRNEASSGWRPHSPLPDTINESATPEFRYHRYYQNSRTHSVDSMSSSISNLNSTNPINDHQIPRTSSQTSLHMQQRSSPCPSDMSFSYSNPKYFVRTAVFRPSSALPTKAPLHYENVIVSNYPC